MRRATFRRRGGLGGFIRFLSTLSLRRATFWKEGAEIDEEDFYPRSPCGERHVNHVLYGLLVYFYPRSPCGERPQTRPARQLNESNFYPRSPCGERPAPGLYLHQRCGISIHALLAESDPDNAVSVRRAAISIHALLAESDGFATKSPHRPENFYPRSPCGERLGKARQIGVVDEISIHALLAESDAASMSIFAPPYNFYPRSPCGERPIIAFFSFALCVFLSTLSLRRATNCTSIGRPKRLYFYPRSPCGERRSLLCFMIHLLSYFYPRSPCGERLYTDLNSAYGALISIHALLAESDARPNCQSK